MQYFRKIFPNGNILVFFSYFTITICALILMSVFNENANNKLSRNNLYTGHQKEFQIEYSADMYIWQEIIEELKNDKDDFAIYIPIEDEKINCRGIFTKGKCIIPPMIEGKYFDEESSFSEQPKCVVGKKYVSRIIKENNKQVYSYLDTKYEVIGIMGTEKESLINEMIFIDFNSALNEVGVNTNYILDTKNTNQIRDIGQQIVRLISLPAEVIIFFGEEDSMSFFKQIFSADKIMDTFYYMLFVSFVLSTMLVTFVWMKNRNQLLQAIAICGFEKRYRYIELFRRYIFVAIEGIVAGIATVYILSKKIDNIILKNEYMINTISCVILFGIIIFLWCYIFNECKDLQ